MASEKTLNTKNLATLGADRLAVLLLELVTGDAAAKRRLRLELASRSGGSDAAAEIRKRLATIAKSRSHVDWRKIKLLAQDLELQRAAIIDHVAPTHPAEAFELLWRLLDMAPSIYARCDDSNGTIGAVFTLALTDLAAVADHAALVPSALADRVFQGVCANTHGQFDQLIGLMANPLGRDGLELLRARFEQEPAIRMPGIERNGPVNDDNCAVTRQPLSAQPALAAIADALGDVDGYANCFSESERCRPTIAAAIAERLLNAGRADEAMAALTAAEAQFRKDGHWPDWQRVRINTLDALGRSEEAQAERWTIFERSLNAEYLRAHLKRLPDFDDEEAEIVALDLVGAHADFHSALAFLLDWPAHDRAAKLILERQGELDGNLYELLTSAAEALEDRHPLAATLSLRAVIDFSLFHGKHKRFGHAARHLRTCEDLARRIEDFGDRRDHAGYRAHLWRLHGRRNGFWNV